MLSSPSFDESCRAREYRQNSRYRKFSHFRTHAQRRPPLR
jgi:hypothetical protein